MFFVHSDPGAGDNVIAINNTWVSQMPTDITLHLRDNFNLGPIGSCLVLRLLRDDDEVEVYCR